MSKERRPRTKLKCAACHKSFLKYTHHYLIAKKAKQPNFYCSPKCKNEAQKTGERIRCHTCSKLVWKTLSQKKRSKSGKHFCSKHCATIFVNSYYKTGERHPNYDKGTGSYRRLALRHYEQKCALCVYNNIKVLQVHHIDGNRTNNKPNNLVILCPTHHQEIALGVTQLHN